MSTTATVFEIINEKFSNIQDLGDGCFQGQRLYKGKVFAIVYFDISDNVVKRADNLLNFQEKLLGTDFFKADVDHRWNNYLYFWAGPNSQQQSEFDKAKLKIEADRHFARKFVLTKDELLSRFENVSDNKLTTHVSEDVSARWDELLCDASLGELVNQDARTVTVERISSGAAFSASISTARNPTMTKISDQLGTGTLRRLRVNKFRSVVNDQEFSFGDVNLIFGQNGVGKTSLLESIEALYCGRIRSDNSTNITQVEGKLDMQDGSSFTVESTKEVSTIKARNLAWYGRSNPRSEAITSSFTQFNFLDTDAAFRLANVTKNHEIIEDLSPLLVGAGTSKLWSYIKKLQGDISTKLNEENKDASSLLERTKFLDIEITRLEKLPSQSTALAKTYRAGLREIGVKWDLRDDNIAILSENRSNLEFLLRGISEAILVTQSTPATKNMLKKRKELVIDNLDTLINYVEEGKNIRESILATNISIKKYKSDIQSLQDWALYCNHGAPALHKNQTQKLMDIEKVHNTISSVLSDEIVKFSEEYEYLTIQDALRVATNNLEIAIEQEHSDIESLQQIERLESSLASLSSELRTIATSIMKHTEDFSHCPICMTTHNEKDLLRKIENINSSEMFIAAEGLRESVKDAKSRSQLEQNIIKSLKSLEKFAAKSNKPATVTVVELREQLLAERQTFFDLKNELLSINLAIDSLSHVGIDWSRYSEIYNIAFLILGEDKDVFSLEVVKKLKESLSRDKDIASETVSRLNNEIINIDKKCRDIAISLGISNVSNITSVELVLEMERSLISLQKSIKFFNEADKYIQIHEDQYFEDIQLSLQQLITDFDRAKHAEHNETVAKNELREKNKELQKVLLKMNNTLSRQQNLEKANNVLCSIIKDYSIEEATREAFESIRIHVSDIFSRIHAPAEYTLGSFYDGLSLRTSEGKEHSVNQVSTGQRAALALSIFLALNLSAENAPPIILIDDPIAHIDDLNALSFIDYLRDLAIDTNKQIFFATADAKLAALFQKKFEFLGERYKKIALPR